MRKGGRLKCLYSVRLLETLMYDELWSEIVDAPGEIFDIPEMREFAEDIDPENLIGYDDQSFNAALESQFDF